MKNVFIALLLIISADYCYSQNASFATSSEEMIKQLIQPEADQKVYKAEEVYTATKKKKRKTRSIGSIPQSLNMNINTPYQKPKKRVRRFIGEANQFAIADKQKNTQLKKDKPVTYKEEYVDTSSLNGAKINLKIEFDVNSSAIRTSSFPLLAEIADALNNAQLKDKEFIINGHTDSDGGEDYNLKLSFERAVSVKLALQNLFKINSNVLNIAGYGEGNQLVPNNTPQNKQLNRRVEIQLVKSK